MGKLSRGHECGQLCPHGLSASRLFIGQCGQHKQVLDYVEHSLIGEEIYKHRPLHTTGVMLTNGYVYVFILPN